ncbi:uncharacterized protein LOC123221396, partial [Mangifera indica]|uniref:uncharacterized protein LOC123221396 n=1 Tax=Mangifera indica TaxID=29780 RepID=UPI001CFB3788
WEFVEKLVKDLDEKDLETQNAIDYTVLHFVAYSESVKTAEILVSKNSKLTQIVSKDGATPLLLSVRQSLHKDMIWYLALVTRFIHVETGVPPDSLRNRKGVPASAFPSFIVRRLYFGKLLKNWISKRTLHNFLFRLVCKHSLSNYYYSFYIILLCSTRFKTSSRSQEEIFNLITEIPATTANLRNTEDVHGNTVRHIAAKLARPSKLLSISGAALQMQREVQWFKEVEKLFDPAKIGEIDVERNTFMDHFTVNHKTFCMIVSTLVATVVFAAAFTVPGGNVGDTGIPVFLRRADFLVFAISDALALLSSSTSLLMFLSILTARYAPEDFLLRLPKRLIIGLGSLFFAIITMMVAFGAALYMLLKDRWESIYIPIIILGCIPVLLFAKQQVPLFYDMVQSTYGSGVFKKKKTW